MRSWTKADRSRVASAIRGATCYTRDPAAALDAVRGDAVTQLRWARLYLAMLVARQEEHAAKDRQAVAWIESEAGALPYPDPAVRAELAARWRASAAKADREAARLRKLVARLGAEGLPPELDLNA